MLNAYFLYAYFPDAFLQIAFFLHKQIKWESKYQKIKYFLDLKMKQFFHCGGLLSKTELYWGQTTRGMSGMENLPWP